STHQIEQDIPAINVASLKGNPAFTVKLTTSPSVFFMGMSKDKAQFPTMANKHIQNAIRAAIDYKGLVSIIGPGTIQAPGLVAQGMLGALPISEDAKQNVARAKAEVAKSGIANPTVSMDYPSGGFQSAGVVFQVVAEKIASDLEAVGIHVTLIG